MKKQKNFLLDDSTVSYIDKVANENNLPTRTSALVKIIDDHKHKNDISATKFLAEEIAKQVAIELKEPLTRIRLGSNNADRNSEVILLLLNTLLSYSTYKSLIEKDTPQLTEARQIIKDRIANYRQKKCNQVDSQQESNTFDDSDLLM